MNLDLEEVATVEGSGIYVSNWSFNLNGEELYTTLLTKEVEEAKDIINEMLKNRYNIPFKILNDQHEASKEMDFWIHKTFPQLRIDNKIVGEIQTNEFINADPYVDEIVEIYLDKDNYFIPFDSIKNDVSKLQVDNTVTVNFNESKYVCTIVDFTNNSIVLELKMTEKELNEWKNEFYNRFSENNQVLDY